MSGGGKRRPEAHDGVGEGVLCGQQGDVEGGDDGTMEHQRQLARVAHARLAYLGQPELGEDGRGRQDVVVPVEVGRLLSGM